MMQLPIATDAAHLILLFHILVIILENLYIQSGHHTVTGDLHVQTLRRGDWVKFLMMRVVGTRDPHTITS